MCSLAHAGIIIPTSVQGPGGGGVTLDVEGYSGNGYFCNIAGVGDCMKQISASGGSAFGHAIAFVDAAGIHGEIDTSATGTYTVASGNPGATIGDTITNNSSQPVTFSFTFTIDGEFDKSGGGEQLCRIDL